MNVEDAVHAMETIAPLSYAAEWDNVGLLIGGRTWSADSILLTIDLTDAVLREAIAGKAQMIVSYHPPIFEAMKSLTSDAPKQKIALETARAGIAVYSPHTALDAAPGGVNDWLAACVGQGDVRALESHEVLPETEQCKIVTFCPAEAVERIRNGLATGGAGRIGKYQLCSFEIVGRGTFLGGDDTNPAVGRRGSLQQVDEVRLEMVCSRSALGSAMIAMREFHPYEEPAVEIYPLLPRPQRGIGQGRRVTLDQPAALRSLLPSIKKHLGVERLHVAMSDQAPARFSRIGVCAGAGGSLLEAVIRQGCELFLTGEMRHHDVLEAQARGCTVVLAGHTNTERGYLKTLRRKLGDALPGGSVVISKRDMDPLKVM